MSEYLTCPFCKETDFDDVGLKMHFENGWCEAYNEVSLTSEKKEKGK